MTLQRADTFVCPENKHQKSLKNVKAHKSHQQNILPFLKAMLLWKNYVPTLMTLVALCLWFSFLHFVFVRRRHLQMPSLLLHGALTFHPTFKLTDYFSTFLKSIIFSILKLYFDTYKKNAFVWLFLSGMAKENLSYTVSM